PAFQRRVGAAFGISPGGTAEAQLGWPSLRDFGPPNRGPSVETLGYSHLSLRDENAQILSEGDRTAVGRYPKNTCPTALLFRFVWLDLFDGGSHEVQPVLSAARRHRGSRCRTR